MNDTSSVRKLNDETGSVKLRSRNSSILGTSLSNTSGESVLLKRDLSNDRGTRSALDIGPGTNKSPWHDLTHTQSEWTEFPQNEEREGEEIAIHKPIDRIPSMRPTIDNQDKLWTQIDVLDDVRQMEKDISQRGSFFDSDHTNCIEKLKNSQLKLLSQMRTLEQTMDDEDYQGVWHHESGDENEEGKKSDLLNGEHFQQVGDCIKALKDDLEEVKNNVKRADRTGNDIWRSRVGDAFAMD